MTNILIISMAFIALLLLGVPVAFALGVPCIGYLLLVPGLPVTVVAQNIMRHMLSFTLISMPGFLFVGRMMNTSGITDRLFKFAIAIVGRFRGGLAMANALASMMFAAMSGTAIGDAGGLGLVEMNMMKEAGYQDDVSAGITAASSILGPIIPPSAAMVLLASICELPVTMLFYGGMGPGILLCLAMILLIAFRAHFTEKGKSWPKTVVPWKQALATIPQAIPALFTFVIILGSILSGLCTATEAAVIAAWYSIILGFCYKKATWKLIWKTLEETVAACGVFMLIVSIATFLAWIFTRENLTSYLATFLTTYSAGNQQFLMIVCVIVFLIIGCFLDTSAAVLLLAPIIIPVVKSVGIDPCYFGVIMVIALMIGIITPPFGICLFVVSEVGEVPVRKTTAEAVKYIPAMILIVLLCIFFPQIISWLPELLM
ncbi:MAG: TRAP transporter large permease [Clostridiales bacterium]|nr:TRAP transporter large permease [Clostridiales bacterium]